MGDRGRVAVEFQGERVRLAAPDYLPDEEKALWVSIVNDQPADAFTVVHIPLLEMFVGHVNRSRFFSEQLDAAIAAIKRGEATVFGSVNDLCRAVDRENKAAASLAIRLRIAPSSTQDPKTRGRQNRREGGAAKPWALSAPEEGSGYPALPQ